MKEQENDKWLDEQIRRVVDSGRPEFDAEQWKLKYPAEYQTLLSRAAGASQRPQGRSDTAWRRMLRNPFVKLAAAAAIVVGVVLLTPRPVSQRRGPEPFGPAAKSPVGMTSAISLNMAYRRGGMAALDEQLEEIVRVLGPSPASVPIQELL